MDFVDKAFSQAAETSKLLITLATALVDCPIVTFTIEKTSSLYAL